MALALVCGRALVRDGRQVEAGMDEIELAVLCAGHCRLVSVVVRVVPMGGYTHSSVLDGADENSNDDDG